MTLLAILSSLAGVGGIAAALVFIPGLATRALEIASGLFGLVTRNPWPAAVIGLCALSMWLWHGKRDALKWQDEVVQATRDASHRPRLAAKNVAQQIRYLGQGIDDFRAAMAEVKAKALAAKLAADQQNEDRRKERDHALDQALPEYRRRADDYARTHSVRGQSDPPAVGGSDHRQRDLPGPTFGAQVANGAGGETDLVTITRSDLGICTDNTGRLENAVEWARGLPWS
jgi:Sec-independent protein translocase protein TatA